MIENEINYIGKMNKYLMIDFKRNNNFCFFEIFSVFRGKVKGNIEVKGK